MTRAHIFWAFPPIFGSVCHLFAGDKAPPPEEVEPQTETKTESRPAIPLLDGLLADED
jgi:hypothetical protein